MAGATRVGGATSGEGAAEGATGFREASLDKGAAGAGGALFGKEVTVAAGAVGVGEAAGGGGETGVLDALAAGAGASGDGAALGGEAALGAGGRRRGEAALGSGGVCGAGVAFREGDEGDWGLAGAACFSGGAENQPDCQTTRETPATNIMRPAATTAFMDQPS